MANEIGAHLLLLLLLLLLVFATPPSALAWQTSGTGRTSTGLRLTSSSDQTEVPATYPLARRALLDRAEQIGATSGSYSAVGWSNRLGSVLTPASVPGVYEAGRPFMWNGIDVGCRMVVIELQGGEEGRPDLFVHSPVALDDRLAGALDSIGSVRHVVSPNYEHVKFAYQWAERYPDACIWACPGLAEREPLVRWTGEIPALARPAGYPPVEGEGDPPSRPEGMWDWDEIQPLHVDTEVNPFTGRPFFNEVVFYHSPSKTLLTTDTYWNYPSPDGITNTVYAEMPGGSSTPTVNAKTGQEERDFGAWDLAPEVGKIPLGSSLWKLGMDKLFRPFYLNLMTKPSSKDRFRHLAAFASGVNESGWDVQTVIPAHGDVIRGKTFCRGVLKQHFDLR